MSLYYPNHICSMLDFESVLCNFFFFYSFQGHNLLIVDQNFKRGGNVKNREDQISMGQSFCINKNVCRFGFVPVIPVSPDATLKERCLGQSQ